MTTGFLQQRDFIESCGFLATEKTDGSAWVVCSLGDYNYFCEMPTEQEAVSIAYDYLNNLNL